MLVTDPPCPFCDQRGVHAFRLPLDDDGCIFATFVCYECGAYGRAYPPVGFVWPDDDPDECDDIEGDE
jgi:hypothetical protein